MVSKFSLLDAMLRKTHQGIFLFIRDGYKGQVFSMLNFKRIGEGLRIFLENC